jgi:hypothetical protein
VKEALTYLPDQVAGAIKQPARQLCIDLLLYESKHRKSLAWKMEELLTGILCNLLRNRLDNKLIDAESGGGAGVFFCLSIPCILMWRTLSI